MAMAPMVLLHSSRPFAHMRRGTAGGATTTQLRSVSRGARGRDRALPFHTC